MALLIIITMFALAAIRGITLQERISGGLYDRELAFSAAEAALRWAERQYMADDKAFMDRIIAADSDPACAGVTNCPATNPPDTGAYFGKETTYAAMADKSGLIKLDGSVGARFQSSSGGSAEDVPLYMAVRLRDGGDCGDAVRINTVGVGRNPNTLVVLESIVCK
jgi:Tfp pilus assembly protein PilX